MGAIIDTIAGWLAKLLGIDAALMKSILAFLQMLIGQLGSKKAAKQWMDDACKDVAKGKPVKLVAK